MEGWRSIGGGSEEGWRKIGGGLEEDGRPKYGLGTPQYVDGCGYLWMDVDICGWTPVVWPGYAPVWGLDRDLLTKCHFFAKMMIF